MFMYETSDLGVAAYLMLKDLELKNCSIGPTGRYSFEFEDPLGVAHELTLEFLKSDFSKFDDKMRTLRKMLKFRSRR
tara:strand:+ start:696 stop:926 length:231 start_codon:yes stop_codon:yes gene_type:complete